MMVETKQAVSGVQELINQIREEGVESARTEAEKIIKAAKDEAVRTLEAARAQADDTRAKAAKEVADEKAAAAEALKLASRDAVLDLVGEIMATFQTYVKRLVGASFEDGDFLREVILAVAGRGAQKIKEGQAVQLLLSESSFGGSDRQEEAEEKCRQFIMKLSADMLREGVTLQASAQKFKGIRVRFQGRNLEMDLTESAVSELLAQHLLPRFRMIVRGLN